jgi:polar amino acid transport system substrate-binding protein
MIMTTIAVSRPISARLSSLGRSIVAALALLIAASAALADEGPAPAKPLTVAVYDAPPYGLVEPDGSVDGVSVDLWRRAAAVMGRQYRLVPVAQMEALLQGLEHNEFDAAIGAITITPERVARVDFSYPAHRSGVAVAVRKDSGAMAAIGKYGAIVAELRPLIAFTAGLLVAMGVAMWLVERPKQSAHESAVASLRDGVYWAVVTMTTVGYGDKTPKTARGRIIAIAWMLASVALISILSTSIVSKMTADRVAGAAPLSDADLEGKRLAAVAHSSGAEYLDERHLRYAPFDDLAAALTALAAGRADAVVNSIETLQYLIAARFGRTIEAPEGVLAPAYMAFALPRGSRSRSTTRWVEITASPEWRRIEQSYFGQ